MGGSGLTIRAVHLFTHKGNRAMRRAARQDAQRRRQPERAIQAAGVKLLRSLGAAVYVLGTTRPKGDYHGTMQTPGLPDVLAFLPMQGVRRLLVWEAKAPKGRLRPAQAQFAQYCHDADIGHVVGTHDALIAWLIEHGYLRADQVAAHHTEGR